MDIISIIALFLKISIVFFVAFQIFKQKFKWALLIAIPFFMTGVELSTYSASPWSYLFSNEASAQDYERAFLGGVLFLITPAIAFFLLSTKFIEKPGENSKS